MSKGRKVKNNVFYLVNISNSWYNINNIFSLDAFMIKIIFENSNFVICEKDTGLLSEFSASSPISLPLLLCKQLSLNELYTVHRLDKDVSGLIVYAKNSTAAAEISRQINDADFNKEYIAIVSGKLDNSEGTLRDLLYHDKQKNKTYVVKKKRAGVKEAVLEYSVIDYDSVNDVSKLKIKLLTGRTHQIRVQFASRGHSILGDRKYGSAINIKPMRLHSHLISFFNASTSERITFTSTPSWI